jgi:hypothetical protein
MAVGMSASGAILLQEGGRSGDARRYADGHLLRPHASKFACAIAILAVVGRRAQMGTPGATRLRLVRLVMGSADPPFARDDGCVSNSPLMEWFGGLANVALKLLATMSSTTTKATRLAMGSATGINPRPIGSAAERRTKR